MATMKESELTEKQSDVLEAYRALVAKHGRLPLNRELGEAVGISENAARSMRDRLVELGLAENNPRGGGTARGGGAKPIAEASTAIVRREPNAPTKTKRKPARTAPAAATPAAGDDDLLASLIERRNMYAEKARALDAAIAALGGESAA